MKKLFALLLTLTLLFTAACAEVGLMNFSTQDMDGNPVTQDIFSDYDLTMINVWATWCGYCIEEMPELAKLKDMLPENVDLITICDDADIETDLAKQILEASGANFQTLMVSEDMRNDFMSQIYAFPTTYFVDSEGVALIAPIEGVPSLEDTAGAYYQIIEQILMLMEG